MTDRPSTRPAPRRSVRALAALALGAAVAVGSAGCTVIPATTPAGSSAAPVPSATVPVSDETAAAALAEFVGFPDLTPLLVPAPEPEVLDPLLDEALALQTGTLSAAVRDGLTGELIYDEGGDRLVAPASAVKILTAVAALDVLGPDHRYTTTAVAQPLSGDRTAVVLDAGGDVLMGTGTNAEWTNGRAGLGSLADRAVQAIRSEGITGEVLVRLDDTGYEGPGESPRWSDDIVSSGNASTVQPIATYGGRATPGRHTNRLHDPALYAAEVFRHHLERSARERGVDITVRPEVARYPLEGRGTELAGVQSATLAQQVAYLLSTSDNQAAEATGRNLAEAAGEPASFEGAARATVASLAGLGVDTEGLDLVDASGLSGANRVSAAQLTATLQVAATAPALTAAVSGLPEAGREGTLAGRMVGTAAEGVVQAKTGTLSSVASLTGTVETEDGRTLLFSFLATDQPGVLYDARTAVDRAAVVLAGCGCR